MDWKYVQLEAEGEIAHVWLNRPERRNALSPAFLAEIESVFSHLQDRCEFKVVVLGGRGLSFSAGADRKEPAGPPARTPREARRAGQVGWRACRAIQDLEAATIARVHGHAIGGGFCLALACDFRIAAADTVFSIPEVDLGVPLSWGAIPRLIHEIGAARARELVTLCEPHTAARLEPWGGVHRAVDAGELDTTVADWAARLAAKPAMALHMTQTQFRAYAARAALGDVSEMDGDLIGAAMHSPEARDRFRWDD